MNKILVALDVPTASAALSLADTLRGTVGGFKIGKQLFTREGPAIVRTMVERGDKVFLDLKFHDIPNTVAGAIDSAAALGVWMVNVHASGGRPMMEAARMAADDAQASTGRRPIVIGVTVLTSLDAATLRSVGVNSSPLEQVVRLAELAQASGLDGVVASPQETAAIRQACGPDFLIVTPGIRGGSAAAAQGAERGGGAPRATEPGGVQGPPRIKNDDQQRTMSPAEAVAAGSSYLVIGRPITAAQDPRAAAAAIASSI